MAKEKYVPPQFDLEGFNCPHCDIFSQQDWGNTRYTAIKTGHVFDFQAMKICVCFKCKGPSIWLDGKIVYPIQSSAPLPNDDMPENVKTIYLEARQINSISPRASSALLRLAIEQLLESMDQKGKNLNEKIGNLVKDGMPKKIQEALDGLRIIGNEAIHPGQIDVTEKPTIAIRLFHIINLIVETIITRDKHISEVYELVPETKKEEIRKRDQK